MSVIFWFSSRPSYDLPNFGLLDWFVKKSGHVIGYAILAVCYWYAGGPRGDHRLFAWLLAMLYAVTDEFHQSFVPGRQPSIVDVMVFDNIGTLIGLWLLSTWRSK